MENINHDEVINGANPTFIWCQLIDYFARTAKYMRHIYRDRDQANKPITWVDLDNVNEKIRKDLDVIYAGTTNVSDSAPITNENKTRNDMKRTIRLTESDLHRVIRGSVKKVLKEAYKDPFNFFPDDDFTKEPTHRIDLFYANGGDVSSPAIFSSDEEAINAAIKEAQSQSKISGGVCGIKVEKYIGGYDEMGFTSLETIYEDGETH